MQLIVDLGVIPAWAQSRALGSVVRSILQATATVNLTLLQINSVAHRTSGGKVPLIPPLYRSGVTYREEPKNWELEHFDTIPVMLKRGWGDCDDLAPWRAAELRFTRADPCANVAVKWKHLPSGGRLYHVVVRRGDGSIEDPSRILGMGRNQKVARAHAGL